MIFIFATVTLVTIFAQASLLFTRYPDYDIFTRQTSGTPPQCQTACQPLNNVSLSCALLPYGPEELCLCTQAVGQMFVSCTDCLVAVNPGGNAVATLQSYESDCAKVGVHFNPPLSISASGSATQSSPSPSQGSPSKSDAHLNFGFVGGFQLFAIFAVTALFAIICV